MIEFAQRPAGTGGEQLAGRSQLDAAGTAFDQRRAEMIFEASICRLIAVGATLRFSAAWRMELVLTSSSKYISARICIHVSPPFGIFDLSGF
ncbi:hypothetical protein GGE20_005136 [Rhizobium leguminosarum]|nr:hypothetical protein [Rhizobium leguminosarum]